MAGDYDLIFADWKASILRQGEVLDQVIRDRVAAGPLSVLDCACGIGTQAIGLALRGHRVSATDISSAAVDRAGKEAAALGVLLATGVADLRTLASQVSGEFDVVLACDNALPHLLSEDELLLAACNMRAKTRPGGLLLASIRDYELLLSQRPRAEVPRVFDDSRGRRIVFQVWDWDDDGRTYTLHLFIIRQAGSRWRTAHSAAPYRALRRDELSRMLQRAGFSEVRWLMPNGTGYYQPLVVARNPQRQVQALSISGRVRWALPARWALPVLKRHGPIAPTSRPFQVENAPVQVTSWLVDTRHRRCVTSESSTTPPTVRALSGRCKSR